MSVIFNMQFIYISLYPLSLLVLDLIIPAKIVSHYHTLMWEKLKLKMSVIPYDEKSAVVLQQ